jgi:hypothetical protein
VLRALFFSMSHRQTDQSLASLNNVFASSTGASLCIRQTVPASSLRAIAPKIQQINTVKSLFVGAFRLGLLNTTLLL